MTLGALRVGRPEPIASGWGQDAFGLFQTFSVGRASQRFRWIPGGTFQMGSPEGEAGRFDRETRHQVTLTRGYWLADTPVTQALWEAVMGRNPSRFQTPDRPVDNVSWEDAQAFIEALNERVPGLHACLPTEAQWEKACRGGTHKATWRGDLTIRGDNDAPELDDIAWYGGNSGHGFELDNGYDSAGWPNKQYDHSTAGSRPVATRRPNPHGLYDMLGNVYEWCADWYADYEPGSQVDPVGPSTGQARVIRGGSWFDLARYCRAAYRVALDPANRDVNLGFRLARGQGAPGAEPE